MLNFGHPNGAPWVAQPEVGPGIKMTLWRKSGTSRHVGGTVVSRLFWDCACQAYPKLWLIQNLHNTLLLHNTSHNNGSYLTCKYCWSKHLQNFTLALMWPQKQTPQPVYIVKSNHAWQWSYSRLNWIESQSSKYTRGIQYGSKLNYNVDFLICM